MLQAPEWYREDLVGQAIQESGTPRTALFLTTKLHPRHHGFNTTLKQMRSSFVNLRTSYLDLVLLHYPRKVTHWSCSLHGSHQVWLNPNGSVMQTLRFSNLPSNSA